MNHSQRIAEILSKRPSKPVQWKTCTNCGNTLPESQFYESRGICKSCYIQQRSAAYNNSKTEVVCKKCGQKHTVSTKYANSNKFHGLCQVCSAVERFANTGARAESIGPSIRVNGCILVATDGGRCSDYLTCMNYTACLEIAATRNWSGWTATKGGVICDRGES